MKARIVQCPNNDTEKERVEIIECDDWEKDQEIIWFYDKKGAIKCLFSLRCIKKIDFVERTKKQ